MGGGGPESGGGRLVTGSQLVAGLEPPPQGGEGAGVPSAVRRVLVGRPGPGRWSAGATRGRRGAGRTAPVEQWFPSRFSIRPFDEESMRHGPVSTKTIRMKEQEGRFVEQILQETPWPHLGRGPRASVTPAASAKDGDWGQRRPLSRPCGAFGRWRDVTAIPVTSTPPVPFPSQ